MGRKPLAIPCDALQLPRALGGQLQAAGHFVAAVLGRRRSCGHCLTFAIAGAGPLPLLVAESPRRGNSRPCPDSGKRQLQLTVEPRFFLVEVSLRKAQGIRPRVFRARIIAIERESGRGRLCGE